MSNSKSSEKNEYIALSKSISEGLEGYSTLEKAEILIQRMQESGLITALSPEKYGGHGLNIRETISVIFNIAKSSGSAGLILSMHLSQLLCLIRHCQGSQYLEGQIIHITKKQKLIASVTSEVVANGDIFGSRCTITPSDESLALEKETPNISYADIAKVFLITALQDEGKKPKQRLILVERNNISLSSVRENKMMGMNGIVNHAYKVKATFDEHAIFSEPFPVIARDTMTPATHLFWAALWSGIAASAIAKSKRFLQKEMKTSEVSVKNEIELKLTEMINQHYVMNALIEKAVDAWELSEHDALGFGASAEFNRLKVICSESVNEICYKALSIIGLRGYAEGGPYSLSENIRDALSAPIMVSNYRLMRNITSIEKFVREEL